MQIGKSKFEMLLQLTNLAVQLQDIWTKVKVVSSIGMQSAIYSCKYIKLPRFAYTSIHPNSKL